VLIIKIMMTGPTCSTFLWIKGY